MAIKRKDNGYVFGGVFLIKWFNDDYNFCYKAMEESDGPNESCCPDSILDLLSPTTSDRALAWRARCREHNARKAMFEKVSKGGRLFEVELPVNFGSAGKHCHFRKIKGKRKHFNVCDPDGNALFPAKVRNMVAHGVVPTKEEQNAA
ncbi:MAG: hypothetical protein KKB70_07390 [Proteobacteria bacterium]|nr:hypothetical protein [Pseudomonadota bacterium]